MNPQRANAEDYLDFLIATQHSYSCLEAGRVQPDCVDRPAHDAFTRLLYRLEPDSEALWQEASTQVTLNKGFLVIDDTTLDKPYATKMELVTRHWSGTHRAVVAGINLQTLLWTDGDRYIPCDYRIYAHAQDGMTKNDHFRVMVQAAQERGLAPEYVLFDMWYSSLENLKLVRECGWHFLTQLKSNRTVNPDRTGNRPLEQCAISAEGTVVHLKGFGLVKVFRIVVQDGDTQTHRPEFVEYWVTNDLTMNELTRLRLSQNASNIETYHRGLKQFLGIEKGQMRLARAQCNHIGLCLRAFLRLEHHCFVQGITWFDAKLDIIRSAVTAYLVNPLYKLPTA